MKPFKMLIAPEAKKVFRKYVNYLRYTIKSEQAVKALVEDFRNTSFSLVIKLFMKASFSDVVYRIHSHPNSVHSDNGVIFSV